MTSQAACAVVFLLGLLLDCGVCRGEVPENLASAFAPPPEFQGQFGQYRSPLKFNDGREVRTSEDWLQRRREILDRWHKVMGPWPKLIEKPNLEILSTEPREDFTQHKVRVQISANRTVDGYLLVPPGNGPFPAVLVPFYDAETSIGINPKSTLRDFAYQLTRRGFVSLSIGSPGGDARLPDIDNLQIQPLSYLGYISANCHTALAQHKQVDPKRIGVVGHSYGGKWAMFASCLDERFAAAAWSDPGIVFDEPRPNVNYWEPWYLGRMFPTPSDPNPKQRDRGVITPDKPRAGAYKTMIEQGMDLHELHVLMAPRPFLVSGGSEDPTLRWIPLNHSIAVNNLLGQKNRVAMTNRPAHNPTDESNEQIYAFFEHFLGKRGE